MARFALKRLAFTIGQVLFVATGTFILLRLLPADPVSRLIGLNSSKEAYAHAQSSIGLNRSLHNRSYRFTPTFQGAL